jgi:D-arabinose 1-dehydrogenase-like Zn-dependent alcohol dehydrogenase
MHERTKQTGTMKALVLNRYGGPDQVAFADLLRPVPKPNEILVQVNAAGLNPVDNSCDGSGQGEGGCAD